jgi:glycolate oxidase
MADMKKLGGVLKTAGGLGKAIRAGAGMAVAGRGFMDDVKWSFHVICEGLTTQSAEFCLEQVREIVGQAGGRELPDSIPRVVRANPFGPVNNMLGPEGERWVPVHGLLPHSRAITAMERIESLFASQRAALELHDINTGYLLATVGASCFVIEPVFFWPDEWMEIHRRSVEPAYLKRLKAKPANPVARELVASVREELVELFSELGAVHLQIGKSYRYREGLHPVAFDLVRAMKNELDPHRRMNPGNLGL